MADSERARLDRTISGWLASQVPPAPPADLLAQVVSSTQTVSPRPAWLARWRGHHLAALRRRRRDRSRWILVLALLALGTSVATFVVGRPSDTDRPVVIAPPPTPVPSMVSTASPSAGNGGLVTYTNVDGGYELLMPARWKAGPSSQDWDYSAIYPEVRSFGEGGARHGAPALIISYGRPDGSVTICRSGCRTVVVQTLDQLEDAVVSTPAGFLDYCISSGRCRERHGDLSLDGVPARYEEFATNDQGTASNCLGCPGAAYHILAIRDGRPIVLSFEYWNIAFERTGPDSEGDFGRAALDKMLASFRFRD